MTDLTGARPSADGRAVALVTGVGRAAGIGAAVSRRLALDGWDVATAFWAPYDERMPWGYDAADRERIARSIRAAGAATTAVPVDLSDPEGPRQLFDAVVADIGPVTALVMCHCKSVDSGLLDTSIESFDRHFAVNTRATWLLIREFAQRFPVGAAPGRIVAITSDHTVGNVPYGASKGAMDRVVLAAARELAHLGLTANVINPGPVDTGWMTEELRASLIAGHPQRRPGQPTDTAALVAFLSSPDGSWINGQLLYSDGGLHA